MNQMIETRCNPKLDTMIPPQNKNYYVVRNAGYACSRYTMKLYLIFLNE